MIVMLVGGVVLGVLLAVISQVVDCISASSRAFSTKMNEVTLHNDPCVYRADVVCAIG